ncbi:MAG: PDZ domain-containing protein, partial [Candidatus Binataceae bacterium]
GQIDGVLLDLAIRGATQNRKSLDDVLRTMNEEYARQGKYYDDSNGIRAAVEEVAGKSFADFFRRYVSGTDEIPYENFLSLAGLGLDVSKQVTPALGFWPGSAFGGKQSSVATVDSNSAAESAGLLPGDELLELDGKPFPQNFRKWLAGRKPGETVKLRIRRDGREIDLTFPVESREEDHYSISEGPHPAEIERRIREGLLHGTTD